MYMYSNKQGEQVIQENTKFIYPNLQQPFQVREDEEMEKLMESIRTNGVMEPIIVREKANGLGGYYEIVSGHRRFKACEKLGIDRLPILIRKMSDDEATLCMVDSNLHREHLLPSEKAYAYKAKMDVLNRQGKRNDITSSQLATKSDSAAEIGKAMNESRDQVYRYIRLTNLTKELLELVDKGRIALTPAVVLSYLPGKYQNKLAEIYERDEVTPSYSQSVKLRKLFYEHKLTDEEVEKVMSEPKPNQKEYVKLSYDSLSAFFPNDYTPKQIEKAIVRMLEERKEQNKQVPKTSGRISVRAEIERLKKEDSESKEKRGDDYER